MSKYTISEFSKLTGYTPQTLRNWEKSGKLTPYRNGDLGHRRYTQEQLDFILNRGGNDFKKQQNAKITYHYFKVSESENPQVLSGYYKRLKEISQDSLDSKILCDVYPENNRTDNLKHLYTISSDIARHKVSEIVLLCVDIIDFYEYKTLAKVFSGLGIQVTLIKNNVLSETLDDKTSLVEMISELSENKQYTRRDILEITTILEENLKEQTKITEID